MVLLHNFIDWVPLGLPAWLFVVTVVVFFHELGHFSAARACGIKVETFSIGFGPAIVSWHDRLGTRWKVSWLPLGGYVKFLGDADAANTPDRRAAERMSPADRAEAFPFKPLYQRAIVVAAGPIANFILAIVIFAAMFMFAGRPAVPPEVASVVKGSPAEAAGIRGGDMIRAINGRAIADFDEIPETVLSSGGQMLEITLERDHRALTTRATPRLMRMTDQLGETGNVLALGIRSGVPAIIGAVRPGSVAARAGLQPGDVVLAADKQEVGAFDQLSAIIANHGQKPITLQAARDGRLVNVRLVPAATHAASSPFGTVSTIPELGVESLRHPSYRIIRYGFVDSVIEGANQTWLIAKGTISYIWEMAAGYADMSQLHGPVGVAGVAKKIAGFGFLALINLAALMSVSIGLINLFPIPMLDGGHLLYYGCEAVLGRPLGERAQDVGFRLGLAVVLGLMILATWNDLSRLNLF